MKILLYLFGAGLLAGCAMQPNPTIVREHDAAGVSTGRYRVLTASGYTQARGTIRQAKMDGLWIFFDSSVKVAEVTYEAGAVSGPYRTYFGGVAFPASAGKLQSEGRLRDGQLAGRYRVYDRLTGQVESEAIFEAGGVIHPVIGPSESAERFALNDVQFVQFLDAAIRKATEHPPQVPAVPQLEKIARQRNG